MEQSFGLFVLAVIFLLLLQTQEVLQLVPTENECKLKKLFTYYIVFYKSQTEIYFMPRTVYTES